MKALVLLLFLVGAYLISQGFFLERSKMEAERIVENKEIHHYNTDSFSSFIPGNNTGSPFNENGMYNIYS